MKMLTVAATAFVVFATSAAAQTDNFPDRKPYQLDVCPYVQISDFWFGNLLDSSGLVRWRFREKATWKNIGTQPITAFEIVVLKYDAFNQREIGDQWIVTGHDSAHWEPLKPGETASDAIIGLRDEKTFTAIAYVRHVRLADGTVWAADPQKVRDAIKKVAPFLREPGDVAPDPVENRK